MGRERKKRKKRSRAGVRRVERDGKATKERRQRVCGKPLEAKVGLRVGRTRALYGCGIAKAKRRCRGQGRSARTEGGKVPGRVLSRRGVRRKSGKGVIAFGTGAERKRREAGWRKRIRSTVRGSKRRRGLPVRGQRTSTNGKTAKRLNVRRIR